MVKEKKRKINKRGNIEMVWSLRRKSYIREEGCLIVLEVCEEVEGW